MFNEPASLSKYIYASLVSIVYLIPADRWIAIGRNPHTSEIVRMYLIIYELAETGLVDVNAAGLAVVDLTVYYGGVGACFHFKTGDSVVVDVIGFEIAL